jgi:hypothetical protein
MARIKKAKPLDEVKDAISTFMAQKPKVMKTRDGTRTVWSKKLERSFKTPNARGHFMISHIEIEES